MTASDQYTHIHIRHGRLIDPANDIDEQLDLYISHGHIAAVGHKPDGFEADRTIDASNHIVCPGLVDLAVHLREPGEEHKATICSETAAAAKGGITTLVCTPDTNPVIDTPAVWELVRRRAKHCGNAHVLAIGALTQGLAGKQLAEMAALKKAGCVAVSNGDHPLANTLVARRALEYAATFDLPVILRSEDHSLKADGCVHEGAVSARLGLPGIPVAAETVAVARDLALAEHSGARIHFHCPSTAGAINMLRTARNQSAPVSSDVAIHQLFLLESDVDDFTISCHVNPPFRSLADREALRNAVADATISAICSDHQPHEPDVKELPFPQTAPGISGLETLLPLALKLVNEDILDLSSAIQRLTSGPADILGLPAGRLSPGSSADICIFDPESIWTLNAEQMLSAGKNTPFHNWELTGQVSYTIFEGRITYER
jgi:dihydroorotase